MKATILKVTGPEPGNVFEILLKIEGNGKTFEDKISCISLHNVEQVVKKYIEDMMQMTKLCGTVIEVKE